VAKKRKSSRPSPKASKTKKKTASKAKTARKPARRILVKKPVTGLEKYTEVDFRPLKAQMRAHIERLGKVKEPSSAVSSALRALQQASDELNAECQPTMIIPTP
jgi:hypothetical protein